MSAWLKRFGLHLAAAVGATGIFVAAAAVGASQTRQQGLIAVEPSAIVVTRTPGAPRKPSVVVVSPATPVPTAAAAPTSPPTAEPTSVSPAAAEPTSPPSAGPTSVPTVPTSGAVAPPARPTRNPAAPQPGPPAPQPGPIEVQPAPDQPEPATEPGPPGAAKPAAARPTPRTPATPRTAPPPTATAPAATSKVAPERSLAGTVKAVLPDGMEVVGGGGREWHVIPAPGALIRLNGKTARLDGLQAGDTVVILGQAQSGAPANRFLAHAITARRK